nr:Rap1-interacting factor 1 amino-terminal protein [Tanacetum cinerariifolium]
MQAVMKLATQVNEKMRETSNIWAPPIYRRLVSADKREKDMSERCLLKVKSIICPPPVALSKALIVDVKKKLLPALEELLKQGKKIQAMQAWGWFTRLMGSYAIKNRHLINQLLKIPEQTFPDSDPQVKIATQTAWEALIDALIILPTQESATKAANEDFFEANGLTKSIKLIMTPLIGIMSSKCDTSVHLSCLNTWKYLLHKFDTFVNHPSVIKTVLNPILKVVFQAGPDNKNIWSWNICLDLLD